jgi:hypothetical protein
VISVRVSVENEGVQVDLRHVSGGKARVSVLLPEPPEYAFGNEYVDWYPQDELRVPHALEMAPGEEEHTIYGRFEKQRPRRFPSAPAQELPAQIEEGGLWLVADGAVDPLLEAAAQAIGRVLAVPCRIAAPNDPTGWSGTRIDLTAREERPVRLARLVSAVERFVRDRGEPR